MKLSGVIVDKPTNIETIHIYALVTTRECLQSEHTERLKSRT